MLKIKRLVASMAFAICAAALSFSAYAQFPSVQVKDLDGKTVDTSTLSNDGKPFVISFFATWCKPCLRELKAIHEVYPDWVDETGMKLIAISIDQAQDVSKVKPLVNLEGWDYDVLIDTNSDFLHAMGGQMVPFVVVCDGDGNVIESHSGYTDGSESHIIELIRQHSDK